MANCKLCCKTATTLVSNGCCSTCDVQSGHNIYNCDGSNCTNKVRFRIAANKLETGDPTNTETFKIADIITKFNALFQASGITADAKTGTPGIFSLCPTCWTSVSTSWRGSGYGTAAGKCVSAGFYFNASRRDYVDNKVVWIDKVRSTAVHELMHWRSKAEEGLQSISSSDNWDEAITDLLGREVYFRLGHTNYASGYGNLPLFCELAATAYMNNYTHKKKDHWKPKRLVSEGKPTAIRNTLDKLYKVDGQRDTTKDAAVKNELIQVIFKLFATYHNKGPATVQGGDNFSIFLQKFKPTGMTNLTFKPVTYARSTSCRYP